jgi:hypothetical protein
MKLNCLDSHICNVFELADDDPNKYLPADEIEQAFGKRSECI